MEEQKSNWIQLSFIEYGLSIEGIMNGITYQTVAEWINAMHPPSFWVKRGETK